MWRGVNPVCRDTAESACHSHYICLLEILRTPDVCVRHPHAHVYLAEHIRIGVILQKHCGCACIVVACCNVQRREADLSLCAVVDEQGYDILMSLLKGHGERSESILQRHTDRELGDWWSHREEMREV